MDVYKDGRSKRRKVTDELVEKVLKMKGTYQQIADEIGNISTASIQKIKTGDYQGDTGLIKLFGTDERIKEVIKEEYVKAFKKEPDKIGYMRLTALIQCYIRPEKIIVQIDIFNCVNEDIFRKLIKRNFYSWIASDNHKTRPVFLNSD